MSRLSTIVNMALLPDLTAVAPAKAGAQYAPDGLGLLGPRFRGDDGRVSASSPLRECPIVEPPVEPVLVAGDVLLHRDVDVGLVDRDARNVGEGEIDEALHVLLVGGLVAFRRGGDGAVDVAVELLRLVAHGVEDRILSVIAPDEEV